MRKKIRFYRQHTLETCGISCVLMVLDLYEKIQYPTEKMEQKLYARYRSRAFMGVNAAAAADCLSRNGLSVTLMHASGKLLENRDGYFPAELYQKLQEEYRKELARCEARIRVETGVCLDSAALKQMLSAGKQLMVECIIPGDADGMHEQVLHWILLYGYEGERFLACDPLSSKIRLREEELENYIDTPIGKICIQIGEENDDYHSV